MNKTAIYRQGDVLLVPIEKAPRNMKAVRREKGALVLAHGEATGHAHTIESRRAELVAPQLVDADGAAELYLLVHGTKPVALTHQEHATIDVEPGNYRVVRQREYSPEAIRNVAD